jgi:plasmid maintenance system antidote protein VapI
MKRMHNPPHPGEVLRDGVFTKTGITVTEFAKRLGESWPHPFEQPNPVR